MRQGRSNDRRTGRPGRKENRILTQAKGVPRRDVTSRQNVRLAPKSVIEADFAIARKRTSREVGGKSRLSQKRRSRCLGPYGVV
jgi:hypothetical protein